jgi:hypothetical protein
LMRFQVKAPSDNDNLRYVAYKIELDSCPVVAGPFS